MQLKKSGLVIELAVSAIVASIEISKIGVIYHVAQLHVIPIAKNPDNQKKPPEPKQSRGLFYFITLSKTAGLRSHRD